MTKTRKVLLLLTTLLLSFALLLACGDELSFDSLSIQAQDRSDVAPGTYSVPYTITDLDKYQSQLGVTVTLEVTESGNPVEIKSGSFTVESGKVYTVKITVKADGGAEKTKSFTVTAQPASEIKHQLTLLRNPEAGGTVSGAGSYSQDTDVLVSADTNPDYIFIGWFLGETLVSFEPEFSYTVTGQTTLTARWEEDDGYTATSDEYFEFALLANDSYNIRKKQGVTLPAQLFLPKRYNGKPVTRLYSSSSNGAFADTDIESVFIPEGYVYLGDAAFYECKNLSSVTLPSGLQSISMYAFADCKSLKSISLPHTVNSIGMRAFWNCRDLTSIDMPDSLTSIGLEAFADCVKLTSVALSKNAATLSEKAFYNCKALTAINVNTENTKFSSENGVLYNKEKTLLFNYPAGKPEQSFTLPQSVTSTGKWSFAWSVNLKSITFHDELERIEDHSFLASGLTSVSIPSSVVYLGQLAFSESREIKSVTFAQDSPLEIINSYAFYYCESIQSIILPRNLTELSSGAFGNCTGLKSVTMLATEPPEVYGSFNGTHSTLVIYVPESSLQAYKSAEKWSNYLNRLQAIPLA